MILTDGTNILQAFPAGVGYRCYFSCCGGNDVAGIIAELEEHLHMRLIPDYEDEFEVIVEADRAKGSRLRSARRVRGLPSH